MALVLPRNNFFLLGLEPRQFTKLKYVLINTAKTASFFLSCLHWVLSFVGTTCHKKAVERFLVKYFLFMAFWADFLLFANFLLFLFCVNFLRLLSYGLNVKFFWLSCWSAKKIFWWLDLVFQASCNLDPFWKFFKVYNNFLAKFCFFIFLITRYFACLKNYYNCIKITFVTKIAISRDKFHIFRFLTVFLKLCF